MGGVQRELLNFGEEIAFRRKAPTGEAPTVAVLLISFLGGGPIHRGGVQRVRTARSRRLRPIALGE
jgi:hypothetical protein